MKNGSAKSPSDEKCCQKSSDTSGTKESKVTKSLSLLVYGLPNKRIVLWRWAKPSGMFKPVENPYWVKARIRFKSHNEVVYAGLNPIDWMEVSGGEGVTLHKIVLTRQQAELCVVAEGRFRPTDEKLTEFIERMHIPDIGSYREYEYENYEKSFVPLLEYSGGYNLPEVLIPFPIKAETVFCAKMYVLVWKLKMRFTRK
jgi:hypothetical protein